MMTSVSTNIIWFKSHEQGSHGHLRIKFEGPYDWCHLPTISIDMDLNRVTLSLPRVFYLLINLDMLFATLRHIICELEDGRHPFPKS